MVMHAHEVSPQLLIRRVRAAFSPSCAGFSGFSGFSTVGRKDSAGISIFIIPLSLAPTTLRFVNPTPNLTSTILPSCQGISPDPGRKDSAGISILEREDHPKTHPKTHIHESFIIPVSSLQVQLSVSLIYIHTYNSTSTAVKYCIKCIYSIMIYALYVLAV